MPVTPTDVGPVTNSQSLTVPISVNAVSEHTSFHFALAFSTMDVNYRPLLAMSGSSNIKSNH